MKTVSIFGLLTACTVAAPLEHLAADGPHGHGSSAGGMSGMGSMTGGAPGGLDLGALLANPNMAAMASKFLPERKAFKVEQLEPKIRKEAKRVRITYGPYQIKGRTASGKFGNSPSMDPAGSSYSDMAGTDFPRDITVLASESMVTTEKFEKIKTSDSLYDHHNVFVNFALKPIELISCSNGKKPVTVPSSVFMAGATENGVMQYTTTDGKFNSGFYIGAKDSIYNGIDVANYNNETRTVYTVSEMEYVPGRIADAKVATQQVVNLGACNGINGAAIHPEAGQKQMTINGTDIVIARDGYLLQTRGHMHDGGVNMAVTLNDKVICDSRAVYGGPGHTTVMDGREWTTIAETSVCSDPIKVTKGDKLGIAAHYDFVAHPERETADGEMAEEMALLILTFADAR